MRFERAVALLRQTEPAVPLAEIAHACGYVDQAHLCREVADLAGCTPRQLAGGDVPILQDDGRLPVPRSGTWTPPPRP